MTCSFLAESKEKHSLREGAQKVRVELGFHSGAPLRTKRDIFPVNLKNQSSFAKLRSGKASKMVHNKEEFLQVCQVDS